MLDESTLSTKDLEGKVVLVDFWGTWCPPCVREAAHLQEMYETWQEDDLVILGLAVGEMKNRKQECPWR